MVDVSTTSFKTRGRAITAPSRHSFFCMSEVFGSHHFQRQEIVTKGDAYSKPKVREIYIPDEDATKWHEGTLQLMYENNFVDMNHLPDSAWVSGGMPEARLLDGVLPHKDNWTFYKLDIKNAFPSVNTDVLMNRVFDRVEDFPDWQQTGLGQHMAMFMHHYMKPYQVDGLPLGAPCSPYLFNMYCIQMDEELAAFCETKGLAYTRYLDDFTFSSPLKEKTLGEDTRREIRRIIESNPGFKINHAKSRLLNRQQHHITITGIAIYPDGRIQPKPTLVNKTLGAFETVADEVFFGHEITTGHLGIVDGYNSVLQGMSVEPHNKTMKFAVNEYHVVRRLVLAALAQQEEPQYVKREPNQEQLAAIEDLFLQVTVGNKEVINWLAAEHRWLWKILLQHNMIDPKVDPI
jgi:hypothetical protein